MTTDTTRDDTAPAARVSELWLFPVKSMAGERVSRWASARCAT